MRYAFLVYCDENSAVTDGERDHREEQFAAVLDGWRSRRLLTGGHRLRPARAACVVRCWAGADIVVTTGPAVQAKEQLAGWLIAECEDLDAAVRLATAIPAAWYGSIEVRPADETLAW